MKIQQSNYRRGAERKSKQLLSRVTQKEFDYVQALADKHTGGNISDLIRLMFAKLGEKL